MISAWLINPAADGHAGLMDKHSQGSVSGRWMLNAGLFFRPTSGPSPDPL